jgi:hypothetical protein
MVLINSPLEKKYSHGGNENNYALIYDDML